MRLIDTHAHLHMAQFDHDRDIVLQRAAEAGVMRIVEIGYDLPSSRAALALAEQYAHIYAVVGIQPNHAHEAPAGWLDEVHTLALHPKAVAIGEIGLDYYRDYAPRATQEYFFRAQLDLASELHMPVVIHSREAHADTLRMLCATSPGQLGILHSFSGNWEYAAACIDAGFLLSFSGPVTFAKASDLHDVARRTPLDYMLIETDSPYLSPHPQRGRRNEPANVRLVAERIAALRDIPLINLTDAVWSNATRIFALDDK